MNNITIEINENETEAQRLGRMVKYLRLSTGMKREDFANYFYIPLGTVRDWEQGKRKMPEYVYELIEYKASKELLMEKKFQRMLLIQNTLLDMNSKRLY